MGLSIYVGKLAGAKEYDPSAYQWYQDDFQQMNKLLRAAGLSEHHEPNNCETWNEDLYGYSGLHLLRRVAAHLHFEDKLPEPVAEEYDDGLVERYYQELSEENHGMFSYVSSGLFDHLIFHSDAEGYYLPVDFERVFFVPEEPEIPGSFLGSVQQLYKECERLAEALQIPEEIDVGSQALWKATESQGEGQTQWERYGMESHSCVVLCAACEHALEHEAAIVFG